MENTRGIGQLARESGLSVSALRFYDGAGVLRPAGVHPRSGYRCYAPEQVLTARLVAHLRRVGMPLAGVRRVLAHRRDPAVAHALLAEHLRALERGLADARRELHAVASLLEALEHPMTPTTVTVSGRAFAETAAAVRFAVGSDPDLPVLGGVLLDLVVEPLTLVATDRYRLALSTAVPRALDGPPVSAVLPAALVDAIAAAAGDEVVLTVDGQAVTASTGGVVIEATALPDSFPDHRALLPDPAPGFSVDERLLAALAAAATRTVVRAADGVATEVTVLHGGPGGELTFSADGDGIGVNREYLLQALDAGGPGQLQLALDGPIAPLVIRSARSTSLLMPVRG